MTKTNREVEVKLRIRELGALQSRLRALGAERVNTKHERNVLLDTDRGDFRRLGAILRVRRMTPAAPPGKSRVRGGRPKAIGGILTFKGQVRRKAARTRKYKVREEIEYRLANAGRMERVLWRLGLRPWFVYEKYRTRYRMRGLVGLHLDLDETPIGTFLELEGPRRMIDKAAKALGYSKKDYIAVSYLELYLREWRRRGRQPGNMVFGT